jgi:hypothetical protein
MNLPNAYPKLNENSKKLQNIDVERLWVNGHLVVVVFVLPTNTPGHACLDKVRHGDAPHVV